ncbi:MAG TPA: NYN domain-containing protein [Candidatus Bathyarchaeia archaeon]|nr:NYN domain-containing protein [Candidatus Bathyarchaeia archaeon]
MEERLQLAVFIDFDNIEIGVKSTLNTELDLSLILEALKERGEVVSKSAYGDWARAGMHSRTLTENAVHMVQRNVTPRGDKNGADINLVVDALEMAFTRPHINGFCIVGGDSDFIALVEKLKQFGKRVLVVGGRSFTSGILQRNCHEFISYENLLSVSRRGSQQQSRGAGGGGRLSLQQGFQQVQRALKILADRGVEPQLGPLKSTLLQLDSTFSERDYGASSFREFIQRLDDHKYLHLRRIDQGYLVEMNGEGREPTGSGRAIARPGAEATAAEANGLDNGAAAADGAGSAPASEPETRPATRSQEEALTLLRGALERLGESRAGKPIYVRHLAQALRTIDSDFDEQAFGFRTLTELMYLGQREGVLRMQRDRQGAWRISPATPAAQEPLKAVASVAELNGEAGGRSPTDDAEREASTPGESGDESSPPVDARAFAFEEREREAEIPLPTDPEDDLLSSQEAAEPATILQRSLVGGGDPDASPGEEGFATESADGAALGGEPADADAAGKPRARRRRTAGASGEAKTTKPRSRSATSRSGSSRRKATKAE